MAPSTSPGDDRPRRAARARKGSREPGGACSQASGAPLTHDDVAVGVRHDVEPALELGEVLVVLAEHQRRQAVVVERHGHLGPLRGAAESVGRAGRPGRASGPDSAPVRREEAARVADGAAQGRAIGRLHDASHSATGVGRLRPLAGNRQASGQRVRADRQDVDRLNGADQVRPALDVDGLQIGDCAADLAGMAAGLLEQHVDRPAHGRAVEGLALLLDAAPAAGPAARASPSSGT